MFHLGVAGRLRAVDLAAQAIFFNLKTMLAGGAAHGQIAVVGGGGDQARAKLAANHFFNNLESQFFFFGAGC